MTSAHDETRGERHHRIRRHYEPRIHPSRPHHEVLDWASAESQRARFDIFASHVPLAGKRLLDVGCGLGDLLSYLQSRGVDVDYTGVDLLDKMVEAARRNHPGRTFVHADMFRANPFEPGSFDVAFCSGAFNLNLGNNEQFLPQAVGTMMSLAREYVVFNLLHKRAASHEGTYYYYHPDDVRQMLQQFPCQVEIVDDYLHNDFTVICKKQP